MTTDTDSIHSAIAIINTITELLAAEPLTIADLTPALVKRGVDMPSDLITDCFVQAMVETGLLERMDTSPARYRTLPGKRQIFFVEN